MCTLRATLWRMIAWIRQLLSQRELPNLGTRGEDLAARFLKKRGYRILHRNFKLADDEADLVAIDPDRRTVVLVEVKTRTDDLTAPEESVTARKQMCLARLASRLQRRSGFADRPFRFDVVAVVLPRHALAAEAGQPVIRHHVGAFASPW
jgi:putative endonuclease